ALAVADLVAEDGRRRGELVRPDLGVAVGRDAIEADGGDAAGDEDAGLGGHGAGPGGAVKANQRGILPRPATPGELAQTGQVPGGIRAGRLGDPLPRTRGAAEP